MQVFVNKPGSKVSIHEGQLRIKHKEGEHSVALQQVKTLFLNRASLLSAEVVWAAMEFDVDVQFVDRRGNPVARLWGNRFGSISTIRKQQLLFSQHPTAALAWVREVLVQKVEQQQTLLALLEVPEHRHWLVEVMAQIGKIAEKLNVVEAVDLATAAPTLRGLEAQAGKLFFQSVSKLLPEQYGFASRSQHPALDMFNALLNYAYGMLYGKVETALIRAGIDPHIGIFHRDDYNRAVLTYDVIEKYRVWADYVVTNLCVQQVIYVEFFEVENGTFYLNEMGKRILIQTMTNYLEEIIPLKGLERSRATHIDLDAQRMATMLKGFTV